MSTRTVDKCRWAKRYRRDVSAEVRRLQAHKTE
jgi:hypothetical protein